MTSDRKWLRAAAKHSQLVSLRKLYDLRSQTLRVRDELVVTDEVKQWLHLAEALERVNAEIARGESILAMVVLEDEESTE